MPVPVLPSTHPLTLRGSFDLLDVDMRHPHLENDTDQLNGFEKPFLILKCLTLGPASRPLAEAITSKVEQIGRSWKMEQQKLLRQMKTVGMCGS